MIARIWRGETRHEDTAAYIFVLRETGLRDYRSTEGNYGVWVFTRRLGERTEFTVLTLWHSRESIERFAGEDINQARYYPQDRCYLLSFPSQVEHLDCALADMDHLDADL